VPKVWLFAVQEERAYSTGKQNHQCKACGRQFVAHAEKRVVIAGEQHTLVKRLLREKISLHGICWAVGVRMKWLMHFMVVRFDAIPDHLHVHLPDSPTAVTLHRLEAEADEMWSFVEKKANKQGSGWPWTPKPARLLPFRSAINASTIP
jgi:insertion element IS1 protein InsB